ncbi:MAG: diguanylate cyclase [Lachnospiraceae bacterium]|jgi:diguanylate cyclase (GGDEF)-like protein|nr:diguanylate cyclase [Lachnospiraceae bacterium]
MKAKSTEKRIMIAATLLTVVFLGLILVFFVRWYYMELSHDISMWQNSASKTGNAIEYYLKDIGKSFTYSSDNVNTMLRNGASNDDILNYMLKESEMISEAKENSVQGIYGYVRGQYLDGDGWVPDREFDPTTRPWYTDAFNQGGKVVIINPYSDLSSDNTIVSFSRCLIDGNSVVAMDLYLDKIVEYINQAVYDQAFAEALLITENGYVVADTANRYAGDYTPEILSLVGERNVANGFFIDNVRNPFLNNGEMSYVYLDEVWDGWYLIISVNNNDAKKSKIATVRFAFVTILLFLAILAIWVYLIQKKKSQSELADKELLSLADLYLTVHLINLRTKEVRMIKSNSIVDSVIQDRYSLVEVSLAEVMEELTATPYLESMRRFVDWETLFERLKDKNAISTEFVASKSNRWCRARFIVVDRDENNNPECLLWTTESINEEKEEEQRLKLLSEQDLLTGIYNRGSGEKNVREALAKKVEGAFILLDADHFKCINDTYGHDVGDKVLIQLANALKQTCRDSDFAIRMGGDEFAVFLKGLTSKEQVEAYMKRVFKKIEDISVSEMNGKTISVSAGVSFKLEEDDKTFTDLYKEADRKTYLSKEVEGNYATF